MPDNLERGDLLYTNNIGAYSVASLTPFNGFLPAKTVHVNHSYVRDVFLQDLTLWPVVLARKLGIGIRK